MKKDKFSCVDVDVLLRWILRDYREKNEIFGITKGLFFEPNAADLFRMERYGRTLESPIGIAAGPHTQLAQNIISGYLCGARYIELKTIQVLDDLEVTKPCIDMRDEGYNCEWSQELRLDESFNEYLNAFILLYILRDLLERDSGVADPGFIFNMSAGYNLEGILSPPVQRFFDRMTDCSRELGEKLEKIAPLYPRVRDLGIPSRLSDNLTVSTMHGCPPDEVEKIGRYFIEERGFHTTIKLNPTLLGPKRLREILNNRLGYETEVPDEAFGHDLKYDDGVSLIENLTAAAKKRGVTFSLKLTNTLETANTRQNLPESEAMVYMSGRALHPISINLTKRLQDRFDGMLDISFSAGVNCFNVADVLACGLRPVTVSSDILKPGGYGRLSQYLEVLTERMAEAGVASLDAWVTKRAGTDTPAAARLANLTRYAAEVVESDLYKKEAFLFQGVKTDRPLTRFDCMDAPCKTACAADQDIPRYIYETREGELDAAFRTILSANPFPNVQGMVCTHLCQTKCTRMNYDAPVLIREIKRFVAQNQAGEAALTPAPANGKSVAVIGAGPSGLSCAFFLALEGFSVDLYESKAMPGGMAADAIPAFRLDAASLKEDIDRILALGVTLHAETRVDSALFEQIRASHDAVYVAVGAQEALSLNIPGADAEGVFDQLTFLKAVHGGQVPELGEKVIVIGGGNAAMDVARAARRLIDTSGEVTLLYRRTRREMPADNDEIREALEEGIRLVELASPERILVEDGKVTGIEAARMRLGDPDASGRRRPVKVEGETFTLPANSIIVAIGQRTRADFFPDGELKADPATFQTPLAGVFAGGDALRGAASLVQAIGDGRKAALAIMREVGIEPAASLIPEDTRRPDVAELRVRQARRVFGPEVAHRPPEERLDFGLYTKTLTEAQAREEASRCLQCDLYCGICVTVCPNRANVLLPCDSVTYPLLHISREAKGKTQVSRVGTAAVNQPYQVVNIADFCNACGNCETFCPTAGAPYRDKFKLHLSRESFEAYGTGVHFTSKSRMEAVIDGVRAVFDSNEKGITCEDPEIRLTFDPTTLDATEVVWKAGAAEKDVRPVSEMAVLYKLLRENVTWLENESESEK